LEFVSWRNLSKVSPAFKAAPTNSFGWPEFRGTYYHFKGGSGTVGFVATTPDAFGFFWQHPFWENTRAAAIKNADGEFVNASPESIAAAGGSAVSSIQSQTPDFRMFITNAPGKTAYPIASFIWLLLPKSNGKAENVAVTDFAKWILTDGQKVALKLGYATLPDGLVEAELKQLE
jgi:phosphate transport system substrate-binding protein